MLTIFFIFTAFIIWVSAMEWEASANWSVIADITSSISSALVGTINSNTVLIISTGKGISAIPIRNAFYVI